MVIPLALGLSGCGEKNKEYTSIEALRDDFVKSGAQCWEWENEKIIEEFKETHKARATCDQRTVLILYTDKEDPMENALGLANFQRELGSEVSLLVGKNWMINSDQAAIAAEGLGGTLITR